MILFGISDVLRLVTTSAATLSVMVHYADYPGPDVLPRRQDTLISTAATTTILAAPGLNMSRTVQSISIVNYHATTASTVTLQLFNGTAAGQAYKVTLAAGESLIYERGHGFDYVNSQGMPKVSESTGSSAPAVSATNIVVLAADVINNAATANTISNITGLSFPVVLGSKYWFEFFIDYTAQAATTGSRWSIDGPSFSRLAYVSNYSLTATSMSFNSASAYGIPAASNTASPSTLGNIAYLTGFITPSVSGNVIARFASEIANSAITAKAGSVCRWMQVA